MGTHRKNHIHNKLKNKNEGNAFSVPSFIKMLVPFNFEDISTFLSIARCPTRSIHLLL